MLLASVPQARPGSSFVPPSAPSTSVHPRGRPTAAFVPLATVAGYGDVLETTGMNLAAHATKARTDAAGRTIEAVDALGKVTSYGYDAGGNVLSVRDPNGVGRDCVYDRLGRDTSCTDTAGDTTTRGYDLAGNVVAETDAKGETSTHSFDARGRETQTNDRLQNVTTFDYDLASNLLSLTDAEGGVTAYAYDAAGRKTEEQYPDHQPGSTVGQTGYGIVELAYDAAGRLLRRTDQLGETITHVYDLAGRRTTREYRTAANSPSGTIADQDDFTFDEAGRVLTAMKGRYTNTVTYAYDDGGRIASESLTVSGQTYTIGRGYDDAGNLDQLTYPDGTVVDRPHTARGNLERVDYGGSLVTSFQYDDGGRETQRTYGNNLVTTTSYVPNDNLVASIANPTVGDYSYTYDANKNRLSESITGVMSSYGYDVGASGYDDEDRLINWERDDGQLDQAWNLSAVGDWDSFTEEGVVQARTHNAVHELTGIDAQPLTYDVKGNLTADHLGRSFAWDADNMLASVTVSPSATVGQEGTHGYAYDALGRRVSKTVDNNDSTFTTTVYAQLTLPIPPLGTVGGQVLAEYAAGAAANSPLRSYAYGEYCDEPLVLVAGTTKHYYHRDGRYDVAALTDGTGAVAERYRYDAYGDWTVADGGGGVLAASALRNGYGFTGRRRDGESGVWYFRCRYYTPRLGSFMQRDPLGLVAGYNLYAGTFVPFAVDPSGMHISYMPYPRPPAVGNGPVYEIRPKTVGPVGLYSIYTTPFRWPESGVPTVYLPPGEVLCIKNGTSCGSDGSKAAGVKSRGRASTIMAGLGCGGTETFDDGGRFLVNAYNSGSTSMGLKYGNFWVYYQSRCTVTLTSGGNICTSELRCTTHFSITDTYDFDWRMIPWRYLGSPYNIRGGYTEETTETVSGRCDCCEEGTSGPPPSAGPNQPPWNPTSIWPMR